MKIKKDFIGMFDVLKGLSIILVLAAHTFGFTSLVFPDDRLMVNGLRFFESGCALMGMFFIFAGYSFHPAADMGKYIKKQARQFLLPYAIVIVLAAIAIAMRGLLCGDFTIGSVSSIVLGGLFGSAGSVRLFDKVWMGSVVALWFLLAFFFGSVLYNLIWRLKNPKMRIALIWILTALAVAVPKKIAFMCPWTLVQSCAVLGFMEIGRLLKKYKLLYKRFHPVFVIAALALWAVMHIYSHVSVGVNEYRFLWLDYIASAAAAVVFIKAYLVSGAAVCDALAPLEYVGRYSMWFFCIHAFELLAFPWDERAAALFPAGVSPIWVFAISLVLRMAFAVLACMGINYAYGRILTRRNGK